MNIEIVIFLNVNKEDLLKNVLAVDKDADIS